MCSEGGMVVINSPTDFTLIHAVGDSTPGYKSLMWNPDGGGAKPES